MALDSRWRLCDARLQERILAVQYDVEHRLTGRIAVVAIDGRVYRAILADIVAEPFEIDDEGYLRIPDSPGLGIALNPEAVARYTLDASMLFAPR